MSLGGLLEDPRVVEDLRGTQMPEDSMIRIPEDGMVTPLPGPPTGGKGGALQPMPVLGQPTDGYQQPAPNVFYAPQGPAAISNFDNTGRIADSTLLAQQAILGRQPTVSSQSTYRYQPLLTPENYQNFYRQQPGMLNPTTPYYPGVPPALAVPDYRNQATQFKQDQLAAKVFAPGTGSGGDSSSGEVAPSAWSQMSEAERAQWVQENPGAYVTGKTMMSAIMPGGVILAGMHDPYMNMSLAEYHAGKASQAAMGGMLPEGQGAPTEVAQPVFDPNIYGYDYTSQPDAMAPVNDYVPGLLGPFTDVATAPASGSATRSISGIGTAAPAVDYGSINDFGGSSDSYAPTANEISFSEAGGYTADVGGYDPTSGYDSDTDSGGGGGGGGGKIVCTAMNHAYGFGSYRNAIWLKYSADKMTKAHEAGYHAIFLPLVDLAYKRSNKPVRIALEHIARHRTADLRAEMRGTKRDPLGRAYRFVLEPLCYAVGKLKGY